MEEEKMKPTALHISSLKRCSIILFILFAALCVHSKTLGETSVQLDGFSFFNALDDASCKSLESPRYTDSLDPGTIPEPGAGAVTMGAMGPCHDPLYAYPAVSQGDGYVSVHQLNFYPSLVLRSGNNILKDGDTVCLGETITVESNLSGGYFRDGAGNSPPISFVSAQQMEETLNNYLAAHKNEVFYNDKKMDYSCSDNISSVVESLTPSIQGYITDHLSGLNAYSEAGMRECVPFIYASVICTPNMQNVSSRQTITLKDAGPMEIGVSYSPQCAVLNPQSYSLIGGYYGAPGTGLKDHNRVFIKPAGWTYKKGDLSAIQSYKNAQTPWLGYLDKNARMDVSMTINVVDTLEKPKLEILNSSIGENVGNYVIRIILKNTGNAKAIIDSAGLNIKTSVVLYAPHALEPGSQSDLLLETDMNGILSMTGPLTLTLNYRSDKLGCMKDRQIKESNVLNTISVIRPFRSVQTYSMDVTGSCTNRYYSCSKKEENNIFELGYKCYNKDPFFDPSIERFTLGYELPQTPPGKIISSAVLNYDIQEVRNSQELIVYGGETGWDPVTCVAGGDICTQSYCPECASPHSLGTDRIKSLQINSSGKYSVDVTDYVASHVSAGQASFQMRGGNEDLWSREGTNSCKEPNAWDYYDMKIRGTPSMVILYI
jgi:hypothetical protein